MTIKLKPPDPPRLRPRLGPINWPEDVSNGDIARGTGLSRTLISKIRSGQRTPSLMTAEKIAGYLGMPLSEFVAGIRKRQGIEAPDLNSL